MAAKKSTKKSAAKNPHAEAYKDLRKSLQALDGLVTHYYLEHHGNPNKQTKRAKEMRDNIAAAHKMIASNYAPSADADNVCPQGTFLCNGECIPIGQICP